MEENTKTDKTWMIFPAMIVGVVVLSIIAAIVTIFLYTNENTTTSNEIDSLRPIVYVGALPQVAVEINELIEAGVFSKEEAVGIINFNAHKTIDGRYVTAFLSPKDEVLLGLSRQEPQTSYIPKAKTNDDKNASRLEKTAREEMIDFYKELYLEKLPELIETGEELYDKKYKKTAYFSPVNITEAKKCYSNYMSGVCGLVTNYTDSYYTFLITYNVYNSRKEQVGTAIAPIDNLAPFKSYRFQAVSLTDFLSFGDERID